MEYSEMEKEIEVRSLNGESITISMPSIKTISDLKLSLIQQFSPATSSQFHLYFHGTKLGVNDQIGSLSIKPGEFIALIPFTKKAKPQTLESEGSAEASQSTQKSVPSNVMESAWRDMMEDLSYLNSTSSEEQPSCLPKFFNESKCEILDKNHTTDSRKRRRKSQVENKAGLPEGLISSLLHSSCTNLIDEDVCKTLHKVLESVSCLMDAATGKCLLLCNVDLQENGQLAQSSRLCLCPPWLITIMKTFTFLNILDGFLQVHHEAVTSDLVKDFTDKLRELGFCTSLEDFKRLSEVFPKAVDFVDLGAKCKLSPDVIVVITSPREKTGQVNGYVKARKMVLSNILSLIKRRQTLFLTTLVEGARLVGFDGKYGKAISMEEFVTSVKKVNPSSNGTSVEKDRRSMEARCCETYPLSPRSMLEHLRKGLGSRGQIVHVEEIGARLADFTEIPDELSECTKSALRSLGISKLYTHQAESIRASLCGRDVVVATMTSSGKSLCYNVPVLEALSQNQQSCALYLFPTKALAQDQLRALQSMTDSFEHFGIGVYDGDTSQDQRNRLRHNARLLITNPDMLHMSILPFHGQFQRILSNLKFVVFDEAHAYKGAFGCHISLILRRLRRLCSHVYGSDPSFVFCTATSANPCEHAMELAKLPTMELIDKDGSPSASKLFTLWNPPLCPKIVVKSVSGRKIKTIVTKRSSPMLEVSHLLSEMVQHGLRTIAFCKTRKLCELVLSYTHEILQDTAPHLVNSICAYRGGYVAEDRRRIESELFSGKLCGIVATNALELGIDVGHVDVTLHLGFPGSIASLWQQAGRSGRRGRHSLAVYVAFEGPLDQYFMKYPSKLFRSPIECCHVDAQNPKVLEQHLVCAALEHPLSLIHDEKYFGSGLNAAVKALQSRGILAADPPRESVAMIWKYIGQEKSPFRSISIRAMEAEKFNVIDEKTNEVLEEIEESRAFFQVYEGAVYMNQGKTYLVKELNLSSKIAVCQRADVKYYTKTRDYTDIDVIGGDLAYPPKASMVPIRETTALTNSCRVTTTWFGFRRICKKTNRVLDTIELALPKYSYDSQAVWIRVPTSVKTAVETKGFSFRAGLHAASHAVHNVVPLYVVCDSSDLAPECANPHETRYVPERILLYDQRPGGTGVSARIQPLFNDLLTSALDMLTSCYCSGDVGCPNCVQTLACQEYNELLHKDAAIMIIKGVLEAEDVFFQQPHKHAGAI